MKKSMKKTVLGAIRAHSMTFILFEALPIAGCLLMRYFFDGTLYTNIELPAVIDVLYYLVIRLLPLLHTFIFFLFPLVNCFCFCLHNRLWSAVNMYIIETKTNKAEISQKVKEARHYYPMWIIYLMIFHTLLSVAAYIAFSNINIEIDGRDISFICQITFIVSLVLQLHSIIRNIFPVSPEKNLRKRVCKHCQCVTNLVTTSKKIKDAEYSTSESTYYTTEKVGEIVTTDTGDTVADVYGEVAHDGYSGGHLISTAIYEHEVKCGVCGHTETICTNSSVLTRKDKKQIENKFYS